MSILEDGRKTPTPVRPRDVPKANADLLELLSFEERQDIREQAREKVLADRKDEAEKALLAQYLEEERRALEPAKQMMGITLDLAPYTKQALIDGREYWHGYYYEVPKDLFDVLAEMQARSWQHDDEVGSPNRNQYQRPAYMGTSNFGDRQIRRELSVTAGTIDSAIMKQRSVLNA